MQEWKLPGYLQNDDDKISYVKRRFLSAPALAGFRVKSALRSSRAALYEVIFGTEAVQNHEAFRVTTSKQHSGNLLQTLEVLKKQLPEILFSQAWLPEGTHWLLSADSYQETCEEEIKIYQAIGQEVLSKSDSRERAKAALLFKEVFSAKKVLAFDATLVTLDYLYRLLQEHNNDEVELLLATGQDETGKKRVVDRFSHACTHDGKKVIALCSDAMSEAINLPAAKSLVLLDVPSVPRIIEQRIGRLERMDSEHEEISVFWPEDDEPFSLKSDKRLIDTLITTDMLIGNNVELPAEGSLCTYFAQQLDAKGQIEGFTRYIDEDGEWLGVQDTTSLLQNLIDGDTALITPQLYDLYKDVDATVKTAISFVESERSWSFFALRGDVRRSAKWLFIEDGKGTTDFTLICKKLQDYLSGGNIVQRRWSEVDLSNQFPRLLHFLRKHEALLLPPKKKRALKVGATFLTQYIEKKMYPTEACRQKAEHLLKWHKGSSELEAVDLHHFADLWLQFLQPALDDKRKEQLRKRKPLSLYDLTLADVPIGEELLDFLLDEGEVASRIDEVVAACIISLKP